MGQSTYRPSAPIRGPPQGTPRGTPTGDPQRALGRGGSTPVAPPPAGAPPAGGLGGPALSSARQVWKDQGKEQRSRTILSTLWGPSGPLLCSEGPWFPPRGAGVPKGPWFPPRWAGVPKGP
ncbi:unnamed protein product [Gadus morhua 'NCC']